ncbi:MULTISPECIES: Eco57I restriction-modification methylase domain-containing protein [Flavobacteriaceae]|uniref:Eco57I restriction-modification methylase domain-containing protein n=1 Tax=Flavobacteriaceae TaxID=49546 RepID=UPI0002FF001F|nr:MULTISPECIES: DNA methyltransferase [Flavobacteriaceae]
MLFFYLDENDRSNRELEIHKQVWSFDNSPVIFVIKKQDVKVYNALNYHKKEKSLEEIPLSPEERQERFSFWNLQSGSTWKWLQQEYLETTKKNKYRKRVNERLFQNIRSVRQILIDEPNGLTENEANSLILRLIFIRYLIDRGVKIDDEEIRGNSLDEKRLSFSRIIQEPTKLDNLFSRLNKNFNGVLFKEVNIKLTSKQSQFLADVFKGEIQEQGAIFEGYYFHIFDFSIIPVEVISGIYESLIDEEKRKLDAAVYTPPFLVEYVLNDTVDKYLANSTSSSCKIFEVAVGSGIFLVQSLRKMIEKEIDLKGKKNNKDFSKRIRNIAKENLYGIDINPEALKVTCFSIYIALLDYQSPKDIEKYPFPNFLGENLFEADCFDLDHQFNEVVKKQKPNFILGNPPWKKDKSLKHLKWINSTKIHNRKITGKLEIAQSFLLRSQDFMQPDTVAALIVTSTIFYNVSTTTREFKHKFLTSFCLDKFLDLSPVKQTLFEQQESPTSIAFYRLANNKNYLENVVEHLSIKVNSFLKYFKMLVIEKYDNKKISQRHFLENDWMFKVALYGNILDFGLIKRLESQNAFKISDLVDGDTLYGGAGISRGKDAKPFPNMIGMPIVENSEINEYYTQVDKANTLEESDVNLARGREIDIFKGKKILLKEQSKNWNKPVISYCDSDSVFRKGTFAISSLNEEIIKPLYGLLISEMATYYMFLIASAWGVGTRPAIRFVDEFLKIPYREPGKGLKNDLINLVNKFLNPFKKHYSEFNLGEPEFDDSVFSQINKLINEVYEIKEYEKDLIDYALNVSRYQFQESKQYLVIDFTQLNPEHYRNRDLVLKKYAEVYLKEMGDLYNAEFIQIEIYPLDHFIAMNFVFLSKEPKDKIIYPQDKNNEKEVLRRLASNLSISQITNTKDPSKNLFIQKDIKGFETNSFYIIKPNEYKCWHRALAWYDVAEFRNTIEQAELNSLSSEINDF